MKIAAIENPGSRQEELGQFLPATPVADFMASMFGPLPRVVLTNLESLNPVKFDGIKPTSGGTPTP